MAAGVGHNRKTRSINSLTILERQKLKDAVSELEKSMTRVAAEHSLQKETVNTVAEEIGIDKALIRRLGKTAFKANYNEEVEKHNEFEDFYAIIMGTS